MGCARQWHAEVDLDEGFLVVLLRSELGLRGPLQGRDHLAKPVGMAILKLAIGVTCHRVNVLDTERFMETL